MQYWLKQVEKQTLVKDALLDLRSNLTPNLVKLGEQVAVDIRTCSAVVQSKALESKVRL